MIRCAISDRANLHGSEEEKDAALLRLAERWAADGVEYVQLREKALDAAALLHLARRMMAVLGTKTQLLVNGRADVALATGAAGVHLTSAADELTPAQVRQVFAHAGRAAPVIGVSCHSVEEVQRARAGRAEFVLFGPVFEKHAGGVRVREGSGLELLRAACLTAGPMPVLALGGVTAENAKACVEAGAAGVAGIRLFAETAHPSTSAVS